MIDRFDAMALFLKVLEEGSFSAAGRVLRMPVATVSRRISDLEAHLGTRLLVRTTRRLSLTDAGQAYAEAARRIIEQVRDAEAQAAGEFVSPRGELVLAAPLLFGRLHVLPVVSDFLAAFPDITVRLVLSDSMAHLVDDHIDMAVRIGVLPDSAMVATRVGMMRTVVCAAPALLAAHGRPVVPADLQALSVIAREAPGVAGPWSFVQEGSAERVTVGLSPRLTVSTAEAARDAAVSGLGVARLLAYQVADAVRAGALELVLEAFEPPPLPVHLVHVARGLMPLKMRVFMDFAVPRLRQALAGL